MNKIILIAHRGESLDAPENTLASINLAWERNADAVEIDVHLTADKKIAVIHDSNTRRTAGKYLKVNAQPLSELKKLDVGIFKGSRWTNERIPSLEEVLDNVPDNKMLFVEIKCGAEIITELYSVIKRSRIKHDQVKIISFSFKIMSLVKENFNSHEVFWLRNVEKNYLQFWKLKHDEIISESLRHKLDGLDVKYSKSVNYEFADKIKSAGLKLFVWTVNNPENAIDLINMNVDGITSDNQYYLREKIGLI